MDYAAKLEKWSKVAKSVTVTTKELKDKFNTLHYSDGPAIKQLLIDATSIYGYAEEGYLVTNSLKKNFFVHAYLKLKLEKEASGEKVVASILDKEADKEISTLRQLRDIFEAQRNTCIEFMRTCRTLIQSTTRVEGKEA